MSWIECSLWVMQFMINLGLWVMIFIKGDEG